MNARTCSLQCDLQHMSQLHRIYSSVRCHRKTYVVNFRRREVELQLSVASMRCHCSCSHPLWERILGRLQGFRDESRHPLHKRYKRVRVLGRDRAGNFIRCEFWMPLHAGRPRRGVVVDTVLKARCAPHKSIPAKA